MRPEVKALRDRICYDMDNVLPLHSEQWDYAKDVLAYIDMIEQMGYKACPIGRGG